MCLFVHCSSVAQGPGVSHKIQQLLNTLKRPKKNRKPIEQYYTEDSDTDGTAHMYTCISYVHYTVHVFLLHMYKGKTV